LQAVKTANAVPGKDAVMTAKPVHSMISPR